MHLTTLSRLFSLPSSMNQFLSTSGEGKAKAEESLVNQDELRENDQIPGSTPSPEGHVTPENLAHKCLSSTLPQSGSDRVFECVEIPISKNFPKVNDKKTLGRTLDDLPHEQPIKLNTSKGSIGSALQQEMTWKEGGHIMVGLDLPPPPKDRPIIGKD